MSACVPYELVSAENDAPAAGSGSGLSGAPGFRRMAFRYESPGAPLCAPAEVGSAARAAQVRRAGVRKRTLEAGRMSARLPERYIAAGRAFAVRACGLG